MDRHSRPVTGHGSLELLAEEGWHRPVLLPAYKVFHGDQTGPAGADEDDLRVQGIQLRVHEFKLAVVKAHGPQLWHTEPAGVDTEGSAS